MKTRLILLALLVFFPSSAALAVRPNQSKQQLFKNASDVVIGSIVKQTETPRRTKNAIYGDITAELKIELVRKGKLKRGQIIKVDYSVIVRTLRRFEGGQGHTRQKRGTRVKVYLQKDKAKANYAVLYPNGFEQVPQRKAKGKAKPKLKPKANGQ